MEVEEIITELKSHSDPSAIEGMARYGITAQNNYGVKVPILRNIAKKTGRNKKLAEKLWSINYRETRILSSMIYPPELVTESQLEKWVKSFDYWEICDQFCMNLFEKIEKAYQKAEDWSSRKEEYVKRSGFVLMARLAVSDKKADDKRFETFLPIIKRESIDERNMIKKAVNWALRQIGKRNRSLNKKAILAAKEIKNIGNPNR